MTPPVTRPTPAREPIAVVGMSAFFPCGRDLAEFWASIVAARPAFRLLPRERLSQDEYYDADPRTPDKTYVRFAALLDGFEFDCAARRVPAQVYRSADVVHWLALEQALRAIEDAGYTERSVPRERTGVIVGNTATGEVSRANALRLRWPYVARALRATAASLGQSPLVVDELIDECEAVFKSPFPDICEDTLPGVMPNTIAGRVCNYLDLGGGGYTVDGACASSLIALARAADALASGDLDLVLAGGIDVSIDPIELVGFSKMGAMAKQRMAVYSQDADGFLPGEGCGWAVLKRLADARAAHDYVYAVIHGWGTSSDGRGALTAPSVRGQQLALARAYASAPYGIGEVDFIEGHGTGTPVGDRVELMALKAMLNGTGRRVGLTALKSIAGHMKAAAGVGSFIKAVLAVNQRAIPPLWGCTRPHTEFEGAPIRPVLDGEVHGRDAVLRAGVSAFGFGGINLHLTVESADPPKAALAAPLPLRALLASTQDSELFVFGRDDRAGLAADLRRHADDVAGLSIGELADFAAHAARGLPANAVWRAATVAGDAEELQRKLRTLAYMLDEAADALVRVDPLQECWVGRRTAAPRIGFLFPGQGSQRVNSGRVLVERHSWAQALVSRASAAFGSIDGRGLDDLLYIREHRASDDRARERASQTLADTTVSQSAVALTSLLFVEALARAGVRPSAVGGHSFGELTAFAIAGALDESELFALARLRGQAMAAPAGRAGTMLSLACDRESAERLCADAAGYVVVANLNSDRQVVVSGEPAAIDAVSAAAAAARIATARLRVSNAFHSTFVAGAAARLREESRVAEHVPALALPLFSSIDGAHVREGDELRGHFARQVVTRVDFVALATAMAREVDLILEVGPGAMLCGLLRDIGAASQLTALPVERDPGSWVAWNRALAACFVHGVELNTRALFEGRLIRPYVRPAERGFIANPCEREFRLPDRSALRHGALTGGLDALIAERANVPPDVVSSYLEVRGEFLAAVAGADMKSGSWNPATAPAAAHAAGQNGGATTQAGETPATESVVAPAQSIETMLVELVAERTGFPLASLTPEMRLLNDLNLESIAAGEIIVRASAAVGAGGRVDPGPLLESSLAEIAAAIRAALGQEGAAADAALDAGTTLDALETLTGRPTWVRHFGVEFAPAPISAETDAAHRPRHVLIVTATPDGVPDRFAAGLAATGARVSVSISGLDGLSDQIDCLVVLLAPTGCVAATRESIAAHVEGLLGSLPPRDWRGTLVLVQPDRLSAGAALDLSLPIASFAASLHFERRDLRVRSVQADPDLDPSELVRLVAAEAATHGPWSSVRFDASGQRFVARPTLLTASERRRRYTLSPDDVVVVSGGGKGITAELAWQLSSHTGARVALLGRSPAHGPDADPEVVSVLSRFGDAARAIYVQCDVTDADSVRAATARVRAALGPVTVVLHGAGLNEPATIEHTRPERATEMIAVKVLGLAHLLQALEDAPPKLVVGLSSIIGFTGMPGNAWYALANAALDRLIDRWGDRHPDADVLSLGYSLWADVGMGVKLDVARHIRRMGVSAIPPEAGADAFLHLLAHDPGARQVIVAARLGGLDSWLPAVRAPRSSPHRFLEEVLTEQPGVECAARVRLTTDRDSYLLDHVYKGTTLFPMVFGLEAMAQVALRAADLPAPDALVIEDIDLARPIVVDPAAGDELIVHAEVLPSQADGLVRVAACLGARQTGFQQPHFAATFVFGGAPPPERCTIARRATPLAIDPAVDIYFRFLFHGPRFQTLRHIYELRSDYCVIDAAHAATPAGGEMVLGDPYFRDALLQAGQVVISQERGLPRRIARLDLRRAVVPAATTLIAEGVLTERTRDRISCDIVVVDEDGLVVQRLTGCTFAIVEHAPDEPTAEDIVSPDERDRRLVTAALGNAARACGVRLPSLQLANMPELHCEARSARRLHEQPLLAAVVTDAASRTNGASSVSALAIVWDDSGAPRVEGRAGLTLSLAHDRRYCVAVAGAGPQGVDVEEVTPRSADEWRSLAGPSQAPLFDRLSADEPADRAGARIWSAVEAVMKAHGARCERLDVARTAGDVRLLETTTADGARTLILTQPLMLSLGRERMIAVVVADETAGAREESHVDAAPDGDERTSADSLGIAGYDGGWLGLGADLETRELTLRWPVTFREAANGDGTVRFTALFDWMGRAREIALMPILLDLAARLGTGEWGMITNHSWVRLTGDVRLGDIVETGFSTRLDGERPESTADLRFCWRRRLARGGTEPVAVGGQSVTWVRLVGHGQVRPEPLPEFLREFVVARMSDRPDDDGRGPLAERGACRWQRSPGPIEGPIVEEREFETGLAESNIVGNIYFAQYFDWMGRLIDRFLYRTSPHMFRQPGAAPRCLEASMMHLVDAMPFARIRVRMSVSALYERGAAFAFNYFVVADDGSARKLARGEAEYEWAADGAATLHAEIGAWLRDTMTASPGEPAAPVRS